jgi:hypothetical protein
LRADELRDVAASTEARVAPQIARSKAIVSGTGDPYNGLTLGARVPDRQTAHRSTNDPT